MCCNQKQYPPVCKQEEVRQKRKKNKNNAHKNEAIQFRILDVSRSGYVSAGYCRKNLFKKWVLSLE